MIMRFEPSSWEPHSRPGRWFSEIFPLAFQRIVALKEGVTTPPGGEIVGDAAESFEFSGDNLTLTFKLRKGASFHNIAPVNGRPIDAQDVVYSWNRFMEKGGQTSNFMNSANPEAPVLSVEAPDSETVVLKLAFPAATLLASLTNDRGAAWLVVPREAESDYDPLQTLIGSGPFSLSEHVPSSHLQFTRSPGYIGPLGGDLPYIETLEYPILTEYSTALAQFVAGRAYNYPVNQSDILGIKDQVSDLQMFEVRPSGRPQAIVFGYRAPENTPFRDERLRQALSMSLDRELYMEATLETAGFEDQGFRIDKRLNSAVSVSSIGDWWLDPEGPDFGENSKYYRLDIAEAKKLLTAAGLPEGLEVSSNSATSGYPRSYQTEIEIIEGMVAEAGFSFSKNQFDYGREWIPDFRDSQGAFEGLAFLNLLGGSTDTIGGLAASYYSKAGSTFIGMDGSGQGTGAGDPKVDADLIKARGEFDTSKRIEIAHDLQRYLGEKQYTVRYPGAATGFSLAWPALKNYFAFEDHSQARVRFLHEWIDDTAAPLA